MRGSWGWTTPILSRAMGTWPCSITGCSTRSWLSSEGEEGSFLGGVRFFVKGFVTDCSSAFSWRLSRGGRGVFFRGVYLCCWVVFRSVFFSGGKQNTSFFSCYFYIFLQTSRTCFLPPYFTSSLITLITSPFFFSSFPSFPDM